MEKYLHEQSHKTKNTAVVGKNPDGSNIYEYYLSPGTKGNATQATREFWAYLGLPFKTGDFATLLERAIQDRTAQKDLESKVKAFSELEPLTTYHRLATTLKGISHVYGLILTGARVDNHHNGKPEEIDPLTLKDLWNALSKHQQEILEAYAALGIRPEQARQIRSDQIKPFNEEYYIISWGENPTDKFNVKTKLGHFAFIYKRTLDPLLTANPNAPFTDLPKVCLDVRDFAKVQFHIHLTAKYWRQRFKTVAGSMHVPANVFNFLEGSTPKDGANAANYDQSAKLRFCRIYDRLMRPYLHPTTEIPIEAPAEMGASKEQLDRIESKLDRLLEGR